MYHNRNYVTFLKKKFFALYLIAILSIKQNGECSVYLPSAIFHFRHKILAEFRYFTAKTSTKGQYLHFI